MKAAETLPPSFWQPFLVFLKLGLTSFGGPIAHLGFFQQEIVEKRKWVSDQVYADLVALCQFLPGPASSQVGFALGYMRAGLRGALGAWLGFTLPSALIMLGCAYGLAYARADSSWIHGLKIAAVAVVAQAVWNMAVKLCPDRTRATIAVLGACLVTALTAAWAQVLAIALGLIAGWLLFRNSAPASLSGLGEKSPHVRAGWFAGTCLAVFFILLIGLPFLAQAAHNPWFSLIDGFYRSGTLVFGGGHVVLPLLEAETVGKGWMNRNEFLAGYGAAQALPGPLFAFAAYLGAVMMPDGPAWLAGLVLLVAILLPSMLLVLGVLPYWGKLRSMRDVQASLMGANAVVVGILLAALYNPVFISSVDSSKSMVLACLAFAALQFWKMPPWALVGACALAGGLML